MSNANRIIHRQKLFGGKRTADEVHRSLSFPPTAACVCGSRKIAIRARVFLPASILVEHFPGLAMDLAKQNEGSVPLVDFKGPSGPVKFARIADTYACDLCKKSMEIALAKGPGPEFHRFKDDLVVHIERGPGEDKPIIQV